MFSRPLSWIISGKERLGRLLILLFFCSSWVLVSASEEPIIPLLNTLNVECFFVNFLTGNTIALNLSLGFIVSSIFYFFVSYLPEERRKRHLKPIVKVRLETTLGKLVSMFKLLLEHSSTEVDLHKLKEADLNNLCKGFPVKKDLNAGKVVKSEYPVEGVYYNATPGVLFANNWFQVTDSIKCLNEVLPIFNDEELTAILLNLEIEPLSKVIRTAITSTSTDLSSYESIISHILKITNKLSEYHVKTLILLM
ncbi:hypothetical protein [Shewanella sp. UCD-KL12]|uniref:hypothetical protein n=1 Tax=Shewanella sp. UCD-KL12 TaxID=1917163 RepID=UPI000971364C|nr:hypothetical protein [Shewanella sp. UCD-KL12]